MSETINFFLKDKVLKRIKKEKHNILSKINKRQLNKMNVYRPISLFNDNRGSADGIFLQYLVKWLNCNNVPGEIVSTFFAASFYVCDLRQNKY